MSKKLRAEYLRSLIFGFEDGLVSTTGVLVGISAGAGSKSLVVLAGFVVVAVEALSMGAGQFLSERSAHQLESEVFDKSAAIAGVIMFFSYMGAGVLTITPIILFPLKTSIPVVIVVAYAALFSLGYAKGKYLKVAPIKSGLEILIIGGIATTIGLVVGRLVRI